MLPSHPPVARILFDESHSESWTIRPEVARSMQPSHPDDSSFALAAEALRSRSLAVDAHVSGPLDGAALADVAVLVIAHPSEPKWEHVVPGGGSPVLGDGEIDALEAFVRGGGGLVLLAEEEQDKYGNNVAALAARFGVSVESALVSDYEHHHEGAPHWVLASLGDGRSEADLLARVDAACFYRATTLSAGPDARVLARAGQESSAPGAPLLVAVQHGAGRVVVAADSDLFGDDCIGDLGHRNLWLNLGHWAAQPSLAAPLPAVPSPAAADPAWLDLKAATDRLRLLQEPDGSVDVDRHGDAEPGSCVDAMAAAVGTLAPLFPHQADYLEAVVEDLRAWVAGGFGKPDFGVSLDLFR